MKVKIEINCDNAAFDESVSAEVARILRDLADTIPLSDLNVPFDRSLRLRDHNGNVVGEMKVIGKREV